MVGRALLAGRLLVNTLKQRILTRPQAVDYPKQGVPVDIDGDRLPRTLIRCKPDWHAAEVVSPRRTDYYESSRALGIMYRSITLDDPEPSLPPRGLGFRPLLDPISQYLEPFVQSYLPLGDFAAQTGDTSIMFRRYADELSYICATHTISNTPGVRLLEAEVVAGTILAKCSQKRWRKDRIYRMRLHASTLARDIQREFVESFEDATREQVIVGMNYAWRAWEYSQRQGNDFGANSFGLIALGIIFECLTKLETPIETV